jgi:hypothetical protein
MVHDLIGLVTSSMATSTMTRVQAVIEQTVSIAGSRPGDAFMPKDLHIWIQFYEGRSVTVLAHVALEWHNSWLIDPYIQILGTRL